MIGEKCAMTGTPVMNHSNGQVRISTKMSHATMLTAEVASAHHCADVSNVVMAEEWGPGEDRQQCRKGSRREG